MITNLSKLEKLDRKVYSGCKFYYQDTRVTRRTHLYEYNEATRQEHNEMSRFIEKIEAKDEWLKSYLTRYYKTTKIDGQTEPAYLMNRCARILGRVEMERSWKTK